ncbi:MAG: selenium metabolism-associated LysR family transcriptional regulator [Acidobacteriota bacterium]
MDIQDLRVFLAVAKHLNFTRAGEEVHLSQPSVSVRIKRLEDGLGVKLFEQLGRKIALTEAGLLLRPYALRVMAALDDARHAIDELQGLERGSLRIGASTTPGMYLLPGIVSEFKSHHPGIEIQMAIKNTREVEESILKNEFDLGFVGGHLISGEVEVIPWFTDEIVLITPPDHPLAKRRKVRFNNLAGEFFILRESGSATRSAIERSLRDANLRVESVVELGNPEAVKQAVRNGLGIALISRFAVETELKAQMLRVIKVRGLQVERELKIVYRKHKHHSRAALMFMKTAKAEYKLRD